MEEEEDDLYGTNAGASGHAAEANGNAAKATDGDEDEDLEEGEEEESDSESVRLTASSSFVGALLTFYLGHRDCHGARRPSRTHDVSICIFH
jgi:hypothetical protein